MPWFILFPKVQVNARKKKLRTGVVGNLLQTQNGCKEYTHLGLDENE